MMGCLCDSDVLCRSGTRIVGMVDYGGIEGVDEFVDAATAAEIGLVVKGDC